MRYTSDRLRGDMDEEAERLFNVAAGYRMAGSAELARKASYAAQAIAAALNAINTLTLAEQAANKEKSS